MLSLEPVQNTTESNDERSTRYFSSIHTCSYEKKKNLASDCSDVICCLFSVPATCMCISGTDLLRQLYMLSHQDRSCRSKLLSHPIRVYWHYANQTSTDPITPYDCQASQLNTNFYITCMTQPAESPTGKVGFTGLPLWRWTPSCLVNRLIGLVGKASASGTEDPEFDSCLHHGDFSRSSHTSDSRIGTPVATLPDA